MDKIVKTTVETMVIDRFGEIAPDHVYMLAKRDDIYPAGTWFLTSCIKDEGGNELGVTIEEIRESLKGLA